MRVPWTKQAATTEPDVSAWVSDHYGAIWQFCRRRVGHDLAADAAQETFVAAWESREKYQEQGTPRAYLFKIAQRICTKHRRAPQDWPLFEEDSIEEIESNLIHRAELKSALEALSPDHRHVVILHEIEGLTYHEIATILEIPVGTVKSRIHHAFLNLRKTLMNQEESA